MINIILFGPPDSGKGTQSAKLIQKYNLMHISTGDLFRKHLKEGTPLGKLAKGYMDNGNLVPDQLVIDMVDDKISAKIGRDIAKKIEDDLTYPGEIKVTVIREVRTVEYAR